VLKLLIFFMPTRQPIMASFLLCTTRALHKPHTLPLPLSITTLPGTSSISDAGQSTEQDSDDEFGFDEVITLSSGKRLNEKCHKSIIITFDVSLLQMTFRVLSLLALTSSEWTSRPRKRSGHQKE
jgi:hypothetical protein